MSPSCSSSEPFLGLAPLARMAFAGADLEPVKRHLLHRLSQDENDANALMDLSIILHLMGQRELGLSLQSMALQIQQVYRIEARRRSGTRLLAFVCPGDLSENNAVEFLVEGSDIAVDLFYIAPGLPLPATVPDHDVAMVAVCESDRNRALLRQLGPFLASWPRPVVCAADRIERLSRDGVCRLLQSERGLVVPVTSRVDRETVSATREFPVIVRPVDSQKGHGLKRLDGPPDVDEYLTSRNETEFYSAPYVDYRSPDGQYRKYRIVLIDGHPYACHMAISSNWIVHYISAGMAETVMKRAEEARFFAEFDQNFALRHQKSLARIADRVELEYAGIDCGETPDGQLLVFEVDSGMTVHSMDSVEVFAYKLPQMQRVFGAFRQMLLHRSNERRFPSVSSVPEVAAHSRIPETEPSRETVCGPP